MNFSLETDLKMKSFLLLLSLFVLSLGDGQLALLEETRAMIYLMRYGYVEPGKWSNALVTERQYTDYVGQAVMEFQSFAGLEQTGLLDNVTMELMMIPRCGVRDIVGHGATVKRRKRYALQGSKWTQSQLTYSVVRYVDQ